MDVLLSTAITSDDSDTDTDNDTKLSRHCTLVGGGSAAAAGPTYAPHMRMDHPLESVAPVGELVTRAMSRGGRQQAAG